MVNEREEIIKKVTKKGARLGGGDPSTWPLDDLKEMKKVLACMLRKVLKEGDTAKSGSVAALVNSFVNVSREIREKEDVDRVDKKVDELLGRR